MASDSTFGPSNPNSKLLNVSLTKSNASGGGYLAKKLNILTETELLAYCDYSIKMFNQTIKNISNGFFECSPFEDKCNSCNFNTICKNAFRADLQRNKNFDLSTFFQKDKPSQ